MANFLNFWRPLCEIERLIYFFNKTSFTWILARLGLGKPLNTACFELGLQFDLMAAKRIPKNYCELTLHAILSKLIGSLHNILKIIFFSITFLYAILVDPWNKLLTLSFELYCQKLRANIGHCNKFASKNVHFFG